MMSEQNLIVYKFQSLYHILNELSSILNFKLVKIENENTLNDYIKNFKNYVIVTKNNNLNIHNIVLINNLPLNVFSLIEKINISFLKNQFNNQSQDKINEYVLDLN